MNTIVNTLQIPAIFTQVAPPTPQNNPMNRNTKWSKFHRPPPPSPPPTTQILATPPITPLKYLPQIY